MLAPQVQQAREFAQLCTRAAPAIFVRAAEGARAEL
jgi:hypothetical protein